MRDISLYIHIPFCLAKCDYCDFFSVPGRKIDDSYIDALLNEAEHYCCLYNIECWKTIYIGGGTPSLLTPLQLKRLLSGLKKCCVKADDVIKYEDSLLECTMEMNPETVSEELLEAASECGVTRISMGVQSLNGKALKAVNRHCGESNIYAALGLLERHWKGQLNLDVIAGLPCQSEKEFINSLEKIISCNPDHISMYSLTVEDGTPLAVKIDSGLEFDSDECDRQWLLGRKILKRNGYFQYEVSNFSRKGAESLHNGAYWKQDDYIGIGSGATGTVYSFSLFSLKDCGNRWTNGHDICGYIKFWTEEYPLLKKDFTGRQIQIKNPAEKEEISLSDQEFEYLMMGLRTLEGVDSNKYRKYYSGLEWNGNLALRLRESSLWNKFVTEGKALEFSGEEGTKFSLTEEGILFLNGLLLEL